jgi:putative membrane protein
VPWCDGVIRSPCARVCSDLRLAEARRLWSELLVTLRELGQGVATALMYDRRNAQSAAARDSAGRVCRYLACLAWELRARLQGGPTADDTSVLEALLDPDEAAYVAAGRLRPAALIGFVRCELHDQYVDGRLPAHIHRTLEGHLSSLDNIVGACGRLFSSPLPPTMSRHIVRCLQLWLFGFPFVLAGTMAPLPCALWVFATSYAFVGIDEVGVQVEQPFDIVPMYKLCLVAMQNLEEAFVRLPPRGRERQQAA